MTYTEKDFDTYQLAENKFHSAQQHFLDRLDEVIALVIEYFKEEELDCWYFEDAPEGQAGTPYISNGQIYHVVFDPWPSSNMELNNHSYRESIPLKFLFMNNEEIIEFLENELKAEEEIQRTKNEKKKRNKEKREEKARRKKELIAKLSPEERKLLGIKVK